RPDARPPACAGPHAWREARASGVKAARKRTFSGSGRGRRQHARMDLFAGQPQTLVADAEGGIRYFPDVVPAEVAARWFALPQQGVAWEAVQRPMYERVVDVPRLL